MPSNPNGRREERITTVHTTLTRANSWMHTQSIRFLHHTRASNYCEGGAEQSIVIALEVGGGEEDGQTIRGRFAPGCDVDIGAYTRTGVSDSITDVTRAPQHAYIYGCVKIRMNTARLN